MPIHSLTTDHGVVLTLDRPERRNALNLEALEEFDVAVRAAAEQGARTLVITGAGGHFCAGADLTELEDVSFTQRLAEVIGNLANLPIVTIAAIEGSCMGLGMQVALACDIRVVADTARFAIPVAKLGLMVDHPTIERVVRYFGEGAARHLVLTGAVLHAEDAWRLGFAQERGDLTVALALAARTAALAPLSQAGSKLGFEVGCGARCETGGEAGGEFGGEDDAAPGVTLQDYRVAFERAWASEDLAEGKLAFSQRRPAHFTGR